MKTATALAVAFLAAAALDAAAAGSLSFTPPPSPRATYSFNPNWKFIRQDVPGAQTPDFNDSAWTTVSLPHTYNDVDSFTAIISHSGGDRSAWTGITWYRKHFKLPAGAKGGKVFLEFEGMKQAGHFWVNGKAAGKFENGVSACGLDLTDLVNFDGDNVIAAKVDNSNGYREEATGEGYEWMGRDFNPNFGGLNHDAWLHLAGKVYQTLPLLENLNTTGVYIYPSHFAIAQKSCDVTVEAQVRNESAESQNVTLSAVVVDADGVARAKLVGPQMAGEVLPLAAGQTKVIKATGALAGARFWDVADPYLYDVYSILTVDGKVVDVCKTHTGFRQTEMKGGAGKGGLWLNGHFEYLKGFAERAVDEWAGLGQAYPDWMHDFNAQMMRDCHANYMRWMHISPQMVDVRASDKAGIVTVCPAGDKERDVTGAQWNQRVEVMRDAMIYFRNNPSIVFWEAGNTSVSVPQMQQLVAMRKELDPEGGRAMGARDGAADSPAITPVAEYFGVMMPQAPQVERLASPSAIFRGYSQDRRDRAPILEFEDLRDEVGRRFWDNFSPPHFGFKKGPQDTWNYNQETFCLQAAQRYNDYWINRISNPAPAHARWSGYASIYWSDENADGRQDSSEVCRVSGKVDAVRLPKEAYYLYRVMQSDTPDIHIIGHWTYPDKTVKTIYVAANYCQSVELFVNGKSHGAVSRPSNGYIYAFPEVAFEPGVIKAVAKAEGTVVAQHEIQTAGPATAIKLTPYTGPGGLLANGSDVAFFDVEVVDAQGRRCPTDEARVDFKVDGPVIWRGGYNSGIVKSVNNLYLSTECGINRVAIRSTLTPGAVTLTATRAGLQSGVARLDSKPVQIENGLMAAAP